MPEHTPLTNAELSHRVRDLQVAKDDHSDAIRGFGERLAVGDQILLQLSKDIGSIKGRIEWATNIVMAAVILAVLALVIGKVSVPGQSAASPPATASYSSSPHSP